MSPVMPPGFEALPSRLWTWATTKIQAAGGVTILTLAAANVLFHVPVHFLGGATYEGGTTYNGSIATTGNLTLLAPDDAGGVDARAETYVDGPPEFYDGKPAGCTFDGGPCWDAGAPGYKPSTPVLVADGGEAVATAAQAGGIGFNASTYSTTDGLIHKVTWTFTPWVLADGSWSVLDLTYCFDAACTTVFRAFDYNGGPELKGDPHPVTMGGSLTVDDLLTQSLHANGTVYATDVHSGALQVTGAATVGGNLTVTGGIAAGSTITAVDGGAYQSSGPIYAPSFTASTGNVTTTAGDFHAGGNDYYGSGVAATRVNYNATNYVSVGDDAVSLVAGGATMTWAENSGYLTVVGNSSTGLDINDNTGPLRLLGGSSVTLRYTGNNTALVVDASGTTLNGDLAVNGSPADITTTAAAATLFASAGVTSVGIGWNASTTTTVNGALQLSRTDAIQFRDGMPSGNVTVVLDAPGNSARLRSVYNNLQLFAGNTNGITIDTSGNATVTGYIAPKSGAGAPTAGDCDAAGEAGFLYVDTTNTRLYLCNGTAWAYK